MDTIIIKDCKNLVIHLNDKELTIENYNKGLKQNEKEIIDLLNSIKLYGPTKH